MALKVYHREHTSAPKKAAKLFSYLILIVGAGLLFWAYYPMISFEIYARLFIRQNTASPIPIDSVASSLQFAESVFADTPVLSSNLRDFTHANAWFPVKTVNAAETGIDVSEYTLSIPKLNLSDLKVEVGGDDLSKSLIHYLPTSKPGQYGNVAIFGHSTLPQLYNKTDYKTIFTYLPQMENGDTVIVDVEGKKYEYEVYDMFIVSPKEVSVIEPKFNAAYMTLITCVPPGTYLNRLVVKAKLKKTLTL
ncbi:MAG: sortase [Weeksellaceae bacterium]